MEPRFGHDQPHPTAYRCEGGGTRAFSSGTGYAVGDHIVFDGANSRQRRPKACARSRTNGPRCSTPQSGVSLSPESGRKPLQMGRDGRIRVSGNSGRRAGRALAQSEDRENVCARRSRRPALCPGLPRLARRRWRSRAAHAGSTRQGHFVTTPSWRRVRCPRLPGPGVGSRRRREQGADF